VVGEAAGRSFDSNSYIAFPTQGEIAGRHPSTPTTGPPRGPRPLPSEDGRGRRTCASRSWTHQLVLRVAMSAHRSTPVNRISKKLPSANIVGAFLGQF